MHSQKIIVLSDFNGTISLTNIAERILRLFADEKWVYYDNLCLDGKISLDEAIIAEYSLLHAPKESIFEEIDKIYQIRPHFIDLVNFLAQSEIEFIIITTGLDFVIQHLLSNLGISNNIKVVSTTAIYKDDNSLEVTGPMRFDTSIIDFKLDHVLHYKKEGFTVVYIGDSYSDFQAVLGADQIFSIRESKLSAYCIKHKLHFEEFEDFQEVIDVIKTK